MGCQGKDAPPRKIYSFPHRAIKQDASGLLGQINFPPGDGMAPIGLSIAPESEVDSCLLTFGGGGENHFLGKGDTLTGPFDGPVMVRAYHAAPCSSLTTGASPIIRPPTLALVGHGILPPSSPKAGPKRYRALAAVDLAAAYAEVDEFPWYGRKFGTVTLVATAGTTYVYKITARTYKRNNADDSASDFDEVELADHEDVTITVSTGNVGIRIEEDCDTIVVYAKDGTGSPFLKAYANIQGDA